MIQLGRKDDRSVSQPDWGVGLRVRVAQPFGCFAGVFGLLLLLALHVSPPRICALSCGSIRDVFRSEEIAAQRQFRIESERSLSAEPREPAGIIYFHIPGTGGTNMEWALAKYACDHRLAMAPVIKGCTICKRRSSKFKENWGDVGKFDVVSAHMPISLVSEFKAGAKRRIVRATHMREPVSAAVKQLRRGSLRDFNGETDLQYRYLLTGTFGPQLWNHTNLSVNEALHFIQQHFDFFGMTSCYSNDYDDFYIRLSGNATDGHNFNSLLYRNTHLARVCHGGRTEEQRNTERDEIIRIRALLLKQARSRCIEHLSNHLREPAATFAQSMSDATCKLLYPEVMFNTTVIFQRVLRSVAAEEFARFKQIQLPADLALGLASRIAYETPLSPYMKKAFKESLENWQGRAGLRETCCSKECSHAWRDWHCVKKGLAS